jgi:hypothetical protein
MPKTTLSRLLALLSIACLLLLAACSPEYNWREVRGKDASFTVLLPDKPVSVTRKINLGDQQVEMTMTAAEVDGVSFAVGYVQLADAKSAVAALDLMRQAMLRNINGTVKTPQLPPAAVGSAGAPAGAIDIDARGTDGGNQPLLLRGHFEAKDNRAYQVIVLGKEQAMPREQLDMFFSSFKPN